MAKAKDAARRTSLDPMSQIKSILNSRIAKHESDGLDVEELNRLKNMVKQNTITSLKRCLHCAKLGHRMADCPNSCTICGDSHVPLRCKKACSCSHYATHTSHNCKEYCLVCRHDDGKLKSDHLTMDCPGVCAICSCKHQTPFGRDCMGHSCKRHHHWCGENHLAESTGCEYECFAEGCVLREMRNHCPLCGDASEETGHNIYKCQHKIQQLEIRPAFRNSRKLQCRWCHQIFTFGHKDHKCSVIAQAQSPYQLPLQPTQSKKRSLT